MKSEWMKVFRDERMMISSMTCSAPPGGVTFSLTLHPSSLLYTRVLQLLLQGAPQGTQLLLGVLRDEAGPSTGRAGRAGAAEAGATAVDGDGAAVVAVLVVVHEVV